MTGGFLFVVFAVVIVFLLCFSFVLLLCLFVCGFFCFVVVAVF